MKTKIIYFGICGKAGSGKSTIARYIEDYIFSKYNIHSHRLPFAKALKDIAISLGWNGLKNQKGRTLLQLLGTEVCRNCIDKDYWVHRWSDSVDEIIDSSKDAIIVIIADDVRFENEVSELKIRKATMIKLVGRCEDLSSKSAIHASEVDLDPDYFDHVISNTGSFADLFAHVCTIVNDVFISVEKTFCKKEPQE